MYEKALKVYDNTNNELGSAGTHANLGCERFLEGYPGEAHS